MFFVLNFKDHTFVSKDTFAAVKKEIFDKKILHCKDGEVEIINAFGDIRYSADLFLREFSESEKESLKPVKSETITEAVECCPYCGEENVYVNWDVKSSGYIAKCQNCKKEIFLCDECLHACDSPTGKCDWHSLDEQTKNCFRGKIKMEGEKI